jgi:hypothetical protein
MLPGDTMWVAIRARGVEWSWLTTEKPVVIACSWSEKYAPVYGGRSTGFQKRPGEVLRGDDADRHRPCDRKRRIVKPEAGGGLRCVWRVHLVEQSAIIAHGLKTMGAAGWDQERGVFIGGEPERLPPAVAGGVGTQIGHHVVNRATNAGDELGFGVWFPLEVHSAHGSGSCGERNALLDEARREPMGSEFVMAKQAGERAAFVRRGLLDDDG